MVLDKEVIEKWKEQVSEVNRANRILKSLFSEMDGSLPELDIIAGVIDELDKISKWGTQVS